jgi:hypothetical protein
MGTRGLIGFMVDGDLKTTYNHFDSYPDGLGVDTLKYVAGLVEQGPEAIAAAAESARCLAVVTNEGEAPTDEQVAKLAAWKNENVGEPTTSGKPSWYQLLRETQGNPAAILASGHIIDGNSFGNDSLFCEWAYVINFDADQIEVYEGFRKTPPTKGHWVNGSPANRRAPAATGETYYPIEQICVFPFADLPEPEAFTSTVNSNSRYADA